MPVLTCPFASIQAIGIEANQVRSPATATLSSELAIKPVAGETWDVEGLTLSFTTTYDATAFTNIVNGYKALTKTKEQIVKQEEALAKAKAALESQRTHLTEELTAAKSIVTEAENIYNAGPTKTLFKEYLEAVKGQRAAEASISAVEREIEGAVETQAGYVHDLETVERELKELGHQQARELMGAPLIVIAKMYARSNELVWNSQLQSLRFAIYGGYGSAEPTKRVSYFAEWKETFDLHVQFDDPISFTERENLRLSLTFAAPPVPKEVEGGLEGLTLENELNISQIQAVVNYSRTTEGRR